MVDREALSGVAAAGLAGDHGGLESDGVHERRDVGGEVVCRYPARGTVGVAVTALRGRVGVDGLRQMREQRLKKPPRVGVAVK